MPELPLGWATETGRDLMTGLLAQLELPNL
jgi:hypothetical protein